MSIATRATLCVAACAALAAAHVPAARAAKTLSSNWAGYVAASSARFTSVSGTWTQPAASCTAGHASYSAVWVGLGGYEHSARGLEQIGTDADCTHGAHAVYAAWFELLPAGSVRIGLGVRPGQVLSASVTLRGRDVTLRMHDLSTGARFSTTRRASALDSSSAEWIVEAPAVCERASCHTLELADFGRALFANAAARAGRHTGPIEDPRWSATEVELRQGAPQGGASRDAPAGRQILAIPSVAGRGGFSVSWREQPLSGEAPALPALPAAGRPGEV